MTRKILFTVAIACGAVLGGCDSSPTGTESRPQFDGRTTTTSTTTANTTTSGGNIGDPCTPQTYTGPYRCVADPNNAGGYIISY